MICFHVTVLQMVWSMKTIPSIHGQSLQLEHRHLLQMLMIITQRLCRIHMNINLVDCSPPLPQYSLLHQHI